jgi:hypothetical protein
MVMKGVTGDEYKRLNEETDDTESDGDGLLGLA